MLKAIVHAAFCIETSDSKNQFQINTMLLSMWSDLTEETKNSISFKKFEKVAKELAREYFADHTDEGCIG